MYYIESFSYWCLNNSNHIHLNSKGHICDFKTIDRLFKSINYLFLLKYRLRIVRMIGFGQKPSSRIFFAFIFPEFVQHRLFLQTLMFLVFSQEN